MLCLLAALPDNASAYCLTSTCSDCPRDENGCTIGGTSVAWPGRCVGFGLHEAASRMVDFATVERLAAEAVATWNAVRCPPSGLPPSIELVGAGPIACGRSEYVGDSANANVLIFRDERWPYAGAGHELATTRVRSRDDGTIVDADIEINALRPLLVGETVGQGTIAGAHDLLSILTHELGHLLGLDHSSDPDSIMQIELPAQLVRTDLAADDVAAVCAAYPPERQARACDPTPRGQFSAQCALDPSTGGACNTAPIGRVRTRADGLVGFALSLIAWLWSRRVYLRSGSRKPCFQSKR